MGDKQKWNVSSSSVFFFFFFFPLTTLYSLSSRWVQVLAPSHEDVIKLLTELLLSLYFLLFFSYFLSVYLWLCTCILKVSESTLDGFVWGWENTCNPLRMVCIGSFCCVCHTRMATPFVNCCRYFSFFFNPQLLCHKRFTSTRDLDFSCFSCNLGYLHKNSWGICQVLNRSISTFLCF